MVDVAGRRRIGECQLADKLYQTLRLFLLVSRFGSDRILGGGKRGGGTVVGQAAVRVAEVPRGCTGGG